MLETHHTLQRTKSQGPQMTQMARSQGCAPYRGWSSLTAHGTRPQRSAQMRDCKVIMNDHIYATFQRALTAGDYEDKCFSLLILFNLMSLHFVLFPRTAPCWAEDEKNMFLAPSEGQTGHLPCYYWGHLLFPHRPPQALPCSRVQRRIWQPTLLLLLPALSCEQVQDFSRKNLKLVQKTREL